MCHGQKCCFSSSDAWTDMLSPVQNWAYREIDFFVDILLNSMGLMTTIEKPRSGVCYCYFEKKNGLKGMLENPSSLIKVYHQGLDEYQMV